MRNVQIEPRTEGKGRTFEALLLASVAANPFWPGGATGSDNFRPVWAMFAGSDQELRAFMANLTLGRKATFSGTGYTGYRHRQSVLELLKSAGYQTIWQREAEGAIATVFLPELFQMDPGMVDPEGASFILLPSREWVQAQNLDPNPLVQHARRCGFLLPPEELAKWAPLAFLFSAYLDRRTRCPLVTDGRFYMQLMLECLKQGLASFSTKDPYYYHDRGFGENQALQYREQDVEEVGLLPGLAFRAKHPDLEKLMAEQVSVFFKLTEGRTI